MHQTGCVAARLARLFWPTQDATAERGGGAAAFRDRERAMGAEPQRWIACVLAVAWHVAGAQALPPIDTAAVRDDTRPTTREGKDLVAALRSAPTEVDLIDLASLGSSAPVEAGAAATALLNGPPSDIRAMAAASLGYIHYEPAQRDLQRVLADPADANASAFAALALGRLGDRAALPALRRAASGYWYPPVRDYATSAINQIEHPALLAPFHRQEWALGRTLPYDSRCALTDRPMVSHELSIDGGRLYGVDKGEFGGGLFFDDGHGHVSQVGAMNVQAIARLGTDIVAISGLSHLGWVNGAVYKLERGQHGDWHATYWRRLPWAPYGAVAEPGQLRIVLPAADILLATDGTFSMAPCPGTRHGEWRDRVGSLRPASPSLFPKSNSLLLAGEP